jgi:sucrose-6-phosphate hydrolase SacC (GH32 family)
MQPVPELEKLRGRNWKHKDIQIENSGEESVHVLEDAHGDCVEIIARFAPTDVQEFGIIVQGTDRITYERGRKRLARAPFELAPDEALSLRIYVDRSATEIFANGRFCKTIRSYHSPDDSKAIAMVARGGKAKVTSLDVWEMKSACE